MFILTIVAAVLVAFAIMPRVIKLSPVDAEEGRDGYEREEAFEDRFPLTPTTESSDGTGSGSVLRRDVR